MKKRPAWWERRAGIRNGRVWHIRATTPRRGGFQNAPGFATLCSKRVDLTWWPRLGLGPEKVCKKCAGAFWDEIMAAHRTSVVASPTIFDADHYWAVCSCDWKGQKQQQHEKACGDARLHLHEQMAPR